LETVPASVTPVTPPPVPVTVLPLVAVAPIPVPIAVSAVAVLPAIPCQGTCSKWHRVSTGLYAGPQSNARCPVVHWLDSVQLALQQPRAPMHYAHLRGRSLLLLLRRSVLKSLSRSLSRLRSLLRLRSLCSRLLSLPRLLLLRSFSLLSAAGSTAPAPASAAASPLPSSSFSYSSNSSAMATNQQVATKTFWKARWRSINGPRLALVAD
jgi:hypothetical protein